MKKFLISLFVIVVLLTITGCNKGVKEKDEKTGKERTTFICVKSGIDKQATNGVYYTLGAKQVAKMDDEGKLTYYSLRSTYTMKSVEDCVASCDTAKKWNDEFNDKNYSGGHRVTDCSCDDKEFYEERIYDDIPNLDNFLRSDIQFLKQDNSFDIDGFISYYEQYGYNCN